MCLRLTNTHKHVYVYDMFAFLHLDWYYNLSNIFSREELKGK